MWWRRTSCAAPLKTTYAKVGNSHCRVRVVAVIISVTLSMLHGRVLREREIGMVNLKKSETHVESRDAHAQLEDLLRSNSLACPMTWLSAAEQVPVEMEYLPRTRNLHDCDNNYDSLVQRLLSFPPKRANRATFKPPKDVALGKYMSTALTFFLHTSFVGEHSNAPELHVLRTSVADSLWARHLACSVGTSEWECFFGRKSSEDSNSIDDETFSIARAIWSRRRSHRQLEFLRHRWLVESAHRRLNACEYTCECSELRVQTQARVTRSSSNTSPSGVE
jgi:hypothetical protein